MKNKTDSTVSDDKCAILDASIEEICNYTHCRGKECGNQVAEEDQKNRM